MALINPQTPARGGPVRLGFKTSVIALFVAIVLIIGLTLVYLSFSAHHRDHQLGREPVHRQGGGIVGGPNWFAVEAGAGTISKF